VSTPRKQVNGGFDADVLVVGLGAMGSMALWRLARRGATVVGFDRFEPPHALGSSHGESRIIRTAYYEGPGYVPLVREAFGLWRELERESDASILTMTGALMIGSRSSDVVAGALDSAKEHGLEHEVLNGVAVQRRFARHHLLDHEVALYEASAGFVRPEAAIAAALGRARALGARTLTEHAVERVDPVPGGVEVGAAGRTWRGRHAIVCAGAWNGAGLLRSLDVKLEVTRQCMVWFRPRTPALHTPDHAPVFVHDLGGSPALFAYGFPSVDGETVKVGVVAETSPLDPETIDRVIHPADLEAAAHYVRTALPDLDPTLVRAVVCLQENSPDRHFVVGAVAPGITVLAGFSGHGFKFAPVIGDIAADLALQGETSRSIAPFSPQRFARDLHRSRT
jgi:sarcosine oxidase